MNVGIFLNMIIDDALTFFFNPLQITDAERMFKANADKNNDIADLRSENVKLRKLVALWSVIDKHVSSCATTDCRQCPVREECEESVYLEGLLGIDQKDLSWRVQKRIDTILEARTCRRVRHDGDAVFWYCSECGGMLARWLDYDDENVHFFCPSCGRKVMNE